MTDYSDDDYVLSESQKDELQQINEQDLSPLERRRLKAEKALERVVNAIYGYDETYPEQIYNQLHECIRLIGERIEPHKPKKGKFHAIFYMCYTSDSGMPETPNTAYTVLSTIFRALHDIDLQLISLDETFITKSGYNNTDYFYVGAPYKFPTSKQRQQNAKENYHTWFNNEPLNKILERFIELMNGRTSDAKLKQIKKDIKALKQIKHDATTDEPTREATKSTIKALKAQKKTIKHDKRRNKPKTTPTRDVELTAKNENKTTDEYLSLDYVLPQETNSSTRASERLTEKRRKRLLAEALRRMTEQLKANRNEREHKQKAKNDILPNEQIKTDQNMTLVNVGYDALKPFDELHIFDFGHLDDFKSWRGYDWELDLITDGLEDEGYEVPDDIQEIFDRAFIGSLADAYYSGKLAKEDALRILEADAVAIINDEARVEARRLLNELKLSLFEPQLEPKQSTIKLTRSTGKRRLRATATRSAPSSLRASTKPKPDVQPPRSKTQINVDTPKITATYDNRRNIATIKPVFKAKLTF